MKSLIMIRHAKSSWEISGQDDFDRTLNARGRRDAPDMAGRLLKQGVHIDAFLSSPAARAKETAAFFIQAFGTAPQQAIYEPALYQAAADTFNVVVENIPDAFGTVAIFAHNPGITDFVNTLTAVRLDDMPTCGIFAVHCRMNTWKEFRNAEKEFWFFDFPKSAR